MLFGDEIGYGRLKKRNEGVLECEVGYCEEILGFAFSKGKICQLLNDLLGN